MLSDTKVIRGLGVAVVSVFLVAGAAFAADGITNPTPDSQPAVVSPTSEPTLDANETAEPAETPDANDNSGNDQGDQANETAEPTETPEANDNSGNDAAKTPEPAETPEANDNSGNDAAKTPEPADDHGGDSGSGGGGNDD